MTHFNFDAIACDYDSFYQTALGQLYDRLQKKTVKSMLPDSNEYPNVIEIGSGTGHWTSFLSENGFKVTGVDISSGMIEIAKGRNIPNADFIRADILDFPMENRKYDIAAAFASLEFTSNPSDTLLKMAQIVRPGGFILIGSLNRNGILIRQRRTAKKEPYLSAQIPDENILHVMLSRFGDPVIRKCCYVLPSAPWLNFITEPMGYILNLGWAEFMVGRIRI